MSLAVDPSHRTPAVVIGGVHLPQRRRDDLYMRMLLRDILHHAKEGARIEFRLGMHVWPRNSQPHLQVFLVSNQDIDVLHDLIEDRHRPVVPTLDVPEFGPIVQVKGGHRTGRLGRLHGLHDQLRGGLG